MFFFFNKLLCFMPPAVWRGCQHACVCDRQRERELIAPTPYSGGCYCTGVNRCYELNCSQCEGYTTLAAVCVDMLQQMCGWVCVSVRPSTSAARQGHFSRPVWFGKAFSWRPASEGQRRGHWLEGSGWQETIRKDARTGEKRTGKEFTRGECNIWELQGGTMWYARERTDMERSGKEHMEGQTKTPGNRVRWDQYGTERRQQKRGKHWTVLTMCGERRVRLN